jgi:hypothetical protein
MSTAGYCDPDWAATMEVLIGTDGALPCAKPDDCPVCLLFEQPRAGESRREWATRLYRAAMPPPPEPKPRRQPPAPHDCLTSGKRMYARGLCATCYHREYQRAHPGRRGRGKDAA